MIGKWAEGRGLVGLKGMGEPGKKIIWNINKVYRKLKTKRIWGRKWSLINSEEFP